MTYYSDNGLPVLEPGSSLIVPLKVAERSFPGGVRAGAVKTVLEHVIIQLHTRVESMDYSSPDADEYAYSYRRNKNNPDAWSCHASASAFDYNATEHPNGVPRTWSPAQVAEIRAIQKEVGYGVHCGMDFSHTKDDMHFQTNGSLKALGVIAKRINNPPWWQGRTLKVGMRGEDVRMVRRRLHLSNSDVYTEGVADYVNRYRRRLHLTENGTVNLALARMIGTPA